MINCLSFYLTTITWNYGSTKCLLWYLTFISIFYWTKRYKTETELNFFFWQQYSQTYSRLAVAVNQTTFQHYKNNQRESYSLPLTVDWRSKSCVCQVLTGKSSALLSGCHSRPEWFETAAYCTWRTSYISTNWTGGGVETCLGLYLPCPAGENDQVESQCWPCVLKIDSINDCTDYLLYKVSFCWSKSSRIRRGNILSTALTGKLESPLWPFDLSVWWTPKMSAFHSHSPCDLEQVTNHHWACMNRNQDRMESISINFSQGE